MILGKTPRPWSSYRSTQRSTGTMGPGNQGSTNAKEMLISIACIPILGSLSGATECKLIVVSSFFVIPMVESLPFFQFRPLPARLPSNGHSNPSISCHFSYFCHFDNNDRKFLTMANSPPSQQPTRRSKRQLAAASSKSPTATLSSPVRKVTRRMTNKNKKQKPKKKNPPPRPPPPSEADKENNPPPPDDLPPLLHRRRHRSK